MKSIEVGRRQDTNKFQSDFAKAFIGDISRISGIRDSSRLSILIYQLTCSLIDAMSVVNFILFQKGIDSPKMRIELHILESGGLKFQIVPLDENGATIKTDKEMPSLGIGANAEETKQFMVQKGSTQLFLIDKLPKEN